MDLKASAFDHVTWSWGFMHEREVAWGGRRRRNWRHKLRWGGSWGLRFEPDFSNVESRRDTPLRPPTFSAFRTAKQQVFSRILIQGLQPPDFSFIASTAAQQHCAQL